MITAYEALLNRFFDLFYLDFAEPLDFQQCAPSSCMHRLTPVRKTILDSWDIKDYRNSVKATGLQLVDISHTNTYSVSALE
mgnify:CR=1 FL=1